MRDDRFSIDIPKRWVRRAVIALAVGMLVLPAAAWAGHQFDDVPDSNIFHEDIDWMADTGVTKGCNPPDNDEYCPEDNVSREQMAAFLHRMDTEDVFVTPEELDDTTDFAVVSYDGTDVAVEADNGLDSATRTDAGDYVLTFEKTVADCSWTGAVGARDGSTVEPHTLSLNADASDDAVINVHIEDGTMTDADAPFNVTVTC